ncbi:MAG: peptide ligase PGM1-related protein, partial [Pleurocapsa sp.]
IATDNLQKEQYKGLLPNDLMDIIAQERLHFDSSSRTGTVFHLMGALSEFGKLGLTSIGNSLEQAQEIYDRVEAVLDRETQIVKPSQDVQDTSLPINWSQ